MVEDNQHETIWSDKDNDTYYKIEKISYTIADTYRRNPRRFVVCPKCAQGQHCQKSSSQPGQDRIGVVDQVTYYANRLCFYD